MIQMLLKLWYLRKVCVQKQEGGLCLKKGGEWNSAAAMKKFYAKAGSIQIASTYHLWLQRNAKPHDDQIKMRKASFRKVAYRFY